MRRLLTAFGLMVVAGCAHYQPRPLSPAQTAVELESRSLTNAALKVFLEKNSHHQLENWPVARWDLDLLTLAAFYYNPGLEVARAEWHVTQGANRTAAARPNPNVTVGTGYDSGIANSVSPWLPAISFDVPIETAGKRKRRVEQAESLSESARFSIATAAWQVRSELRSSLVDFDSARQRLEFLEQQVHLQQDLLTRLDHQREAGAIAAAEMTSARITLAKTRADLVDAQRQSIEARARLAEAVGVPAAALSGINIDFRLSQVIPADPLISAEARSTALRSRTDILSALADYAASQSALQLEIAKQYPDVHVSPGYSWNQNGTGDNEWLLGFTVELPLLDQNQGPIAEAKARRDAVAARFIALQAKVIAEIDRVVAVYEASRKNLAAQEQLTATQKKQFESTEEQFEDGAADQVEVLGARLDFVTTTLAELDAQVKLQQAVGALEDAVQRPLSGNVNATVAFDDTDAMPGRDKNQGHAGHSAQPRNTE
jgi:outer membrane protein TolC